MEKERFKGEKEIRSTRAEISIPVTIHKCGDFVQAPIKRTTFLCWTFLHFRLIKIPSQRMYGCRYTYNKLIKKHNFGNYPFINVKIKRNHHQLAGENIKTVQGIWRFWICNYSTLRFARRSSHYYSITMLECKEFNELHILLFHFQSASLFLIH